MNEDLFRLQTFWCNHVGGGSSSGSRIDDTDSKCDIQRSETATQMLSLIRQRLVEEQMRSWNKPDQALSEKRSVLSLSLSGKLDFSLRRTDDKLHRSFFGSPSFHRFSVPSNYFVLFLWIKLLLKPHLLAPSSTIMNVLGTLILPLQHLSLCFCTELNPREDFRWCRRVVRRGVCWSTIVASPTRASMDA